MSILNLFLIGLGAALVLAIVIVASLALAAQDEERSFPQPKSEESGR